MQVCVHKIRRKEKPALNLPKSVSQETPYHRVLLHVPVKPRCIHYFVNLFLVIARRLLACGCIQIFMFSLIIAANDYKSKLCFGLHRLLLLLLAASCCIVVTS